MYFFFLHKILIKIIQYQNFPQISGNNKKFHSIKVEKYLIVEFEIHN